MCCLPFLWEQSKSLYPLCSAQGKYMLSFNGQCQTASQNRQCSIHWLFSLHIWRMGTAKVCSSPNPLSQVKPSFVFLLTRPLLTRLMNTVCGDDKTILAGTLFSFHLIRAQKHLVYWKLLICLVCQQFPISALWSLVLIWFWFWQGFTRQCRFTFNS